MKLSEAIRLGAMSTPHTRLFIWDDGATCALGAAYHAAGILIVADDGWTVSVPLAKETFPLLCADAPTCPDCRKTLQELCECSEPFEFADVIVHLNDNHEWARERIADWVATIEAQHDVTAALRNGPLGPAHPEPRVVSADGHEVAR